MKTCFKCKELKDVTLFGKSTTAKDKLHSWCKSCVSGARMRRYYENHDEERKNGNRRNKKAREKNKERLIEYLKQHPCVDCGESDFVVLEFDHRERDQKVANVSVLIRKRYVWENIMSEIDKCDVRCANCHRRRTAKQFNWYD